MMKSTDELIRNTNTHLLAGTVAATIVLLEHNYWEAVAGLWGMHGARFLMGWLLEAVLDKKRTMR